MYHFQLYKIITFVKVNANFWSKNLVLKIEHVHKYIPLDY